MAPPKKDDPPKKERTKEDQDREMQKNVDIIRKG